MSSRRLLSRSLAVSLVALAAACTTRGGPMVLPDTGIVPPDGGPDAALPRYDTGSWPDSGPSLADTLIYAHSPTTLFTFSPESNTVIEVGTFTLASGEEAPDMVDLAVNAEGQVFTTSATALWSVNPETARATQIDEFDVAEREQFYALTFLTPGTLGSTEVLLGATNMGVYYEIDPRDASVRRLGSYPDGWLSSGDLVSVEGATYATIRRESDREYDTLAQITFDDAGRSTIRVIGPIRGGGTNFRQLFGLGYWGRAVYGFSNSGQLVEIDRTTGAGRLTTTSTGTERFWGAGVTTRAPVLY